MENGDDVLCLTISSGISGTFNAAMLAARELMEEYKDRFIHIVDSKGIGYNGLSPVGLSELRPYGTVKGAGKRDVLRTRILFY